MSNEEQFVSDIYQAQNTEAPSSELDEKILAEAKDLMAVKPQTSKSNWRKWQWPASVAASVAFVSVILFTQYSSFSPNIGDSDLTPEIMVDPYALADEATLDAEQLALAQMKRRQQAAEILARKESQEKKVMTNKQELSAIRALQNDNDSSDTLSQPELAKYAEKEAATLAARALDNIELDILPFEVDESTPIDVGLQQDDNIIVTGARVAESQMRAADAEVEAMIVLSQSTMANSDYLDQLLANYKDIQAQISKLAGQDKSKNLQLKDQLEEIQNTAFDHLKLVKLAEPNLTLQSKYIDILSEQQRKILLLEQTNE